MKLVAAALLCAGILGAQARGGRGGAPPAPAVPGPCDRACLEGFVNQYLDALVARNPFGLPLAPKIKFTENAQPLDFGDGLWNVVTDIGSYKIYVADPQSQQVGFMGTLRENGNPVALALRLKIDNRKISEIETLVMRTSGMPNGRGGGVPTTGALGLETMKPDPVLSETFPEGQRASREVLVKSADSYFDALEKSDGNTAQLDSNCARVENGSLVKNTCAQQLGSKQYGYIRAVFPRRYPVVDEERQMVFGFVTYQVPGDILSVEVPEHGMYKFPEALTQPGFIEAAELFGMKSGKIRKIEALTVNLPYGTPDPYSSEDWRKKK